MKPSLVALPGLVLAFAVPSLARADVPPPPGYVEQCTAEKQQGAGEECLSCGDAYHGDRDACDRQHAGNGYARRCRTSGASVWTEVWCKKSAGGSAPAPAGPVEAKPEPTQPSGKSEGTAGATPASSGSRCAVDAGGGSGWLLAALGLVFVRRRRA
jgi:hypothetical protein